jgi:membrane protein implicated in regulation of membrane protease activity
MQKTLLIVGALFMIAGLLWPVLSRIGLGRLPGDIAIRGDGFAFYFPLTTMIILSVIVSVLLRLFSK